MREAKKGYTAQLRDRFTQEKNKFYQQTDTVEKFHEDAKRGVAVATSNVRAQMKAVCMSRQAGRPDYSGTPVDKLEAKRYERFVREIDDEQRQLVAIRGEIKKLFDQDTAAAAAAAESGNHSISTLGQWLKTYGQPKRTPNKHEKWLSFVQRPRTKVFGACSKDGTVCFAGEWSMALPLRRGALLE